MLRTLLLAAAAAAFLMTSAGAHAAKPPSFALWSASESNYEDSLTAPIVKGCQKLFAKDDLKAGECLVHGALAIFPKMNANWERGVGRIARGQTPACKKAIHAYWLASGKNFVASSGYFKAHQHTAITDINSDLNEEPYATLKSVKDETKSKAIRVCG